MLQSHPRAAHPVPAPDLPILPPVSAMRRAVAEPEGKSSCPFALPKADSQSLRPSTKPSTSPPQSDPSTFQCRFRTRNETRSTELGQGTPMSLPSGSGTTTRATFTKRLLVLRSHEILAKKSTQTRRATGMTRSGTVSKRTRTKRMTTSDAWWTGESPAASSYVIPLLMQSGILPPHAPLQLVDILLLFVVIY
jgi:hypothetical protein